MKKLSLKPNFSGQAEVLTRAQLKNVMGGNGATTPVEPGSGGCCAHNADWSISQCGYPDAAQAEAAASSAAQQSQTGSHYYWCCQSC